MLWYGVPVGSGEDKGGNWKNDANQFIIHHPFPIHV